MSRKFYIGFQQFALLPPEGTPIGRPSFEWFVNECKRIDAHALAMMPVNGLPDSEYDFGYVDYSDMGQVREMAAMAREADIRYTLYVRSIWSLAGMNHPLTGDAPMDKAEAVRNVEKCMEIAELFSSDTFAGGYGKLEIDYGRYSKKASYDEVKKYVVANLKALGKILQGSNIMMAFENHCDFSGKEIARMLEEVDHPNIGGMYDIGNGAVVYCDAMEDVDYLAPWAVAAHFKDFKVVNNPEFQPMWQAMPMLVKGALLGEGYLDFDVIMKAILEKAKKKDNFIMMAEPAFIVPEDKDHFKDIAEFHQFDRTCSWQFVQYMQDLVKRYS